MAKTKPPLKLYSWQVEWKPAPVANQIGLENAVLDLLRRHGRVPCAALAMLFHSTKIPMGCDLERACRSLAERGFIVLRVEKVGICTVPHIQPANALFIPQHP